MIVNEKKGNFCVKCGKPLTKHDSTNICERCRDIKVAKAKEKVSISICATPVLLCMISAIRRFINKR